MRNLITRVCNLGIYDETGSDDERPYTVRQNSIETTYPNGEWKADYHVLLNRFQTPDQAIDYAWEMSKNGSGSE